MSGAAWLAFLVLLPAGTWLLGALLGLRDLAEPAAAVGRLVRALLPFLAAAALLGTEAGAPALAAVMTAVALHAAWSFGVPLIVRRTTRPAPDADDA